jgi:hypothetical protein
MKKSNLKDKVPPVMYERLLDNEVYDVTLGEPKSFVIPSRLDIIAKYLFLKLYKDKAASFGLRVYEEHLRAFNSFEEKDGTGKEGFEKYKEEFEDLISNISANGLDSKKSVLVSNLEGCPLDGSHRIAVALWKNLKIPMIKISHPSPNYNYQFFQAKGLSEDYVQSLVKEFCSLREDTFVALVWPRVSGNVDKLEEVFGQENIVYSNTVLLSKQGAKNLVVSAYTYEPWLGSIKNKYVGAEGKVKECFKDGANELRYYVVTAHNPEEMLLKKQQIRDIFGVGKHSIHITDTADECVSILDCLLNKNSVHFINNADLSYFKNFETFFEAYLKKTTSSSEDYLVVSSGSLSAYGIRDCKDIDYLTSKKKLTGDSNLSLHDSQLHFYDLPKEDLVYDPSNYFYYRSRKFLSLGALKKLKLHRNEKKDVFDVGLMEAFFSGTYSLKFKFLEIRRQTHSFALTIRNWVAINILSVILPQKIKGYLKRKFL